MRRDICLFYQQSVPVVFDAYIKAAKERFDKDCDVNPYYSLTFGLNFSLKYNMNGGACTVHFMPYNGGTAVNVRYSIAQGAAARYEAHNRDLTKSVAEYSNCQPTEAFIDVEEFLKPENQMHMRPAYEVVPQATAQPVFRGENQPIPQNTPRTNIQPVAQYTYQGEQPAYGTVPAVEVQPQAQPQPQPQPKPVAETYIPSDPAPAKPAYDTTPEVECQPVSEPLVEAAVEAPVEVEEKVAYCAECGSVLRPNAKFCSACGKPVVVEPPKCPNCGEILSEEDKFCFNCGTKVK